MYFEVGSRYFKSSYTTIVTKISIEMAIVNYINKLSTQHNINN